MSESVDWAAATRIGVSLLRPGPKMTQIARANVVSRLRDIAPQAVELVAEASRLPNAEAAASGVTLVVDRAGILRANVAVMRTVMDQLGSESPSLAEKVAGRIAGAGAGTVLALVATNVLGQYEPFSQRLLLSAPSIEGVRAQIDANPRDFALWVCLHEQTHRHQFAAAPWLRGHMTDLMRRVLESAQDDEPARRREGHDDGRPDLGLLGVLSSPTTSAVLNEVTALMSLLEGYADMLMDIAGRPAIPSLQRIRTAVDARRQPARWNPRALVGRALGLAAKIDQYVGGKAFCEGVCEQIGLDGLNVAFSSPAALPTLEELTNPSAWVARQASLVL